MAGSASGLRADSRAHSAGRLQQRAPRRIRLPSSACRAHGPGIGCRNLGTRVLRLVLW